MLNSALEKSDIKPSEAAAKAFLQKELLALSKDERDMLNQQLTTQNKTIDQYINELSANADFQKFVAQRQYAESTYLKDVNVTEADAEKFYNENKKDFIEPGDKEDQIRASHILVKVEPNADENAQKM